MSPPQNHLVRVDVLRAIAILLVFFCHGLPGVDAAGNYEALGLAGVALFFVISGFCIHLSYLNEMRKHPALSLAGFSRQFLWRRFWRIYPPYLAALLVFWFLENRHQPLPAWHFWTHFFLVNNLSPASFYSIAAPFWSLGVEWQFYLMYPFFLWCVARAGLRTCLVGVLAISLLMRGLACYQQDWTQTLNPCLWYSPLVLFFDWSLGVLLADLWVKKKTATGLEMAAIPAFFLFLAAALGHYTRGLAFTLASLSGAGALSFYVRRPDACGKFARLLVPIGLCSYSFYLWHHPLIDRLFHWFHRAGVPDGAAANTVLLVTGILFSLLLLSWGLYRLVEKPAIATGRLLWSRWATPPADGDAVKLRSPI